MAFAGALIIIVALISASEGATGGTLGFSIILMGAGVVGWTTYGYFLFGSEDNNCYYVPAMSGWRSLMITLLCIGSIPYLILAIVILVNICKGLSSCCYEKEEEKRDFGNYDEMDAMMAAD